VRERGSPSIWSAHTALSNAKNQKSLTKERVRVWANAQLQRSRFACWRCGSLALISGLWRRWRKAGQLVGQCELIKLSCPIEGARGPAEIQTQRNDRFNGGQ